MVNSHNDTQKAMAIDHIVRSFGYRFVNVIRLIYNMYVLNIIAGDILNIE